VLVFDDADRAASVTEDSANPYLRFRGSLAVDAIGATLGLGDARRREIVAAADARVAAVSGVGFHATPLTRADGLSDALGFSSEGGVWVKDETGNVAGSHKARHLFTILLHLVFAEEASAVPWSGPRDRPPLAIASCGNAAVAAAALAASHDWPIRVFVPPTASAEVTAILARHRAEVIECPRIPNDPPGDPCIHRFRESVADGAVPFSVQGTENVWCLDGGRTLGWELVAADRWSGLSRVYVQVGGGAFASCIGSAALGARPGPALHPVQAAGCAPLRRAWTRASDADALDDLARRWDEFMWPWDGPSSLADGILDDETYDWISVLRATRGTGGHPVVADERDIESAWHAARERTGIAVSPTGSAGLAGLLAERSSVADDESVAVIFSGVVR
jgi:threonine synthase